MFRRLLSQPVLSSLRQGSHARVDNITGPRNANNSFVLVSKPVHHNIFVHQSKTFATMTINNKCDFDRTRPLNNHESVNKNPLTLFDRKFSTSLICESSTSHEKRAAWSPTVTCSAYDQRDLPHLPVPEVDQTMNKLKDVVLPFAMNSFELADTLHLIDRFGKFIAPKLTILLRNKALQTQNWCTHDWWTSETYLRSRDPLVAGTSPGMIYPRCPPTNGNRRTLNVFVGKLVSAFMDFKHEIDTSGTIPTEVRQNGLCHEQYMRLFGTTRIPQTNIDNLITRHSDDQTFKIVISFKNNFYELNLTDVIDSRFARERVDIVSQAIDKIVNNELHSNENKNIPVGVLTASNRDLWANAYKLLNEEALNSINDSQFVLCLDTIDCDAAHIQQMLTGPDQREFQRRIGAQVLHSDIANIGNRWFDKTLQLIIVADTNVEHLIGAGINYEHSLTEGIPIASLLDYSFKKVSTSSQSSFTDDKENELQLSFNTISLKPLEFAKNDTELIQLRQYVQEARQNFITLIDQLELDVLNFTEYGKNLIKSWHMSPDSWIQVALSWAYYRLNRRMGACYESASVRKFSHGRTETIRSLTNDVAQFCTNPNYETLLTAVRSHKQYSVDATNGLGVDRVLMAYRMILSELRAGTWQWGFDGVENAEQLFNERDQATISAFFNNELIRRSKRFALSTSQVGSIYPHVFMIYGPFVADGYACCYNPTVNQITLAFTANSNNAIYTSDVGKYRDSVERCLHDMKGMVESHHQSTKSKL